MTAALLVVEHSFYLFPNLNDHSNEKSNEPPCVHGTLLRYWLFLSVSSCKDSNVSPEEEASVTSIITPEIQSKIDWIKSRGFTGKEVLYEKGTFFIDGDIMMSEQDVDARMRTGKSGSGKNAQRHWQYLVDVDKVKDIKVAFQTGDEYVRYSNGYVEYRFEVDAAWEKAFSDALEVWNQIQGSTLNFRKVDYTNEYDIKIFAVQSYTMPAVAAGDLPLVSKVAGPKVKVSNGYSSLSQDEKLSTAIHEIGHTISLTHTNQKDESGLDYQIIATPKLGQDNQSVMNFSLNNDSPTALSVDDIKAVEMLYPSVESCIEIQFPIRAALESYEAIKWKVSDAMCDIPELVDLKLYKNDSYIRSISRQRSGNSGLYSWYNIKASRKLKTQMEEPDYNIRMIDSNNGQELGRSRYFTIYKSFFDPNNNKFNQFISFPTVEHQFNSGSTISIQWQIFSSSSTVEISLYYSGRLYKSIGTTANDGYHTFKLPRSSKNNIGWQIHIKDSNDSNNDDVTHAFTILGFDE